MTGWCLIALFLEEILNVSTMIYGSRIVFVDTRERLVHGTGKSLAAAKITCGSTLFHYDFILII